MAVTILAPQVGKRLDHDLKAISEAENEENNDKILYIRRGELAFETYEKLFTIVPLETD